MKIKKFKFPSFKEWYDSDKDITVQVGDYYCRISPFICDKEILYKIAVSTNKNPLNIHSDKISCYSTNISYHDYYSLEYWYNEVIRKINEDWERYIQKTYLDYNDSFNIYFCNMIHPYKEYENIISLEYLGDENFKLTDKDNNIYIQKVKFGETLQIISEIKKGK